MLDQVGLDQRLGVDAVAVLRRDEDALDLDRALVAVLVDLVADRHLRLAVGPQVREDRRPCAPPTSRLASLCASMIGSGISSGVSSVA